MSFPGCLIRTLGNDESEPVPGGIREPRPTISARIVRSLSRVRSLRVAWGCPLHRVSSLEWTLPPKSALLFTASSQDSFTGGIDDSPEAPRCNSDACWGGLVGHWTVRASDVLSRVSFVHCGPALVACAIRVFSDSLASTVVMINLNGIYRPGGDCWRSPDSSLSRHSPLHRIDVHPLFG